MKKTLLLLFSLYALFAFGQDRERIAINGKIIVQSEDKEGVTVYNTSSNRGATTDKEGYFKISVAVNDVVEFGALQFQDFTVVISEKIINSRSLTVILVEEVNKLDEVILLPIYPARELPIPGVTSDMLIEKMSISKKLFFWN